MSNSNSGGSTFPLFGLLGIVFIVLKLTEVIDWSWWWVLAPFWGPLAALIVLAIITFGLALLVKRSAKKRFARASASYNDPFDHPFFKNNN
jgi:phosphoglycerol transferase MdoB-like AlkP superfamily enzyme